MKRVNKAHWAGVRALVATILLFSSVALSSMALSSSAWANTLTEASPAVGSQLITAPNAISVSAAVSLLDQGNSLTVTDPNGRQVDDGSLTINDNTAVVGVKPLTVSGIYTVAYTLLSLTDDPLTGSYTFMYTAPITITAPSVSPSVSPSPQTSVIDTVATPAPATTVDSAATVTVWVFVGIATLVALFLLWYARMIWVQFKKSRRASAKKRGAK